MRSEDRDKHLSLRVSHISASSARGNFSMDLSVLRWPFCGLFLYSDPTYRITRDTQFPINSLVTKLIFRQRAIRDLLSNRIVFVWARVVCQSTSSPTPARWLKGFRQVGKCTRVMRYFGTAARSARGEEEEWSQLPR